MQFRGEAIDADLGQAVDRSGGHPQRQRLARGVVGQQRQLQGQAFAQVARADAGRIEALQLVQHGLQFVVVDFEFRAQRRRSASGDSRR